MRKPTSTSIAALAALALAGSAQAADTGGAAASTQPAPTQALDIDDGATRVTASDTGPAVDAQVASRRTFFNGPRPAALDYLVQGSAPVRVSVVLAQAGTETVVASWEPRIVEPGTVRHVAWNGLVAGTGEPAPRGRYEFRVYTAEDTARAAQRSTAPVAAESFLFLDHRFPIRGRHDYGSTGARFGAGRGGHSHQGHDVFAQCGTPLVAARGGVVKFAGFHSRAGNYIVIDGAATGTDYVYMHLEGPALFAKGDKVRTGDQVGTVGDTGVAYGCHLHFELWSAPGWYTGGKPFDPLADLRAWDRYS